MLALDAAGDAGWCVQLANRSTECALNMAVTWSFSPPGVVVEEALEHCDYAERTLKLLVISHCVRRLSAKNLRIHLSFRMSGYVQLELRIWLMRSALEWQIYTQTRAATDTEDILTKREERGTRYGQKGKESRYLFLRSETWGIVLIWDLWLAIRHHMHSILPVLIVSKKLPTLSCECKLQKKVCAVQPDRSWSSRIQPVIDQFGP